MITKLSIVNATFYSYHGVSQSEKQLGGKYQIDVELWYDATQAVITDSIGFALNYQNVLFVVSDFMQNESFNLIETLSFKILEEILKKFTLVEEAKIRIRKCNVPIAQVVDYVEVENYIKRS